MKILDFKEIVEPFFNENRLAFWTLDVQSTDDLIVKIASRDDNEAKLLFEKICENEIKWNFLLADYYIRDSFIERRAKYWHNWA